MERSGTPGRARAAFTLIELVLVMAILIIVMSMTGASLTSFFKGRALDSEVRRFVTLTRHAQSRAASEGLPMSLWINQRERKYGLEIAAGFTESDPKAVEYFLGRDIEIEVARPTTGALLQPGAMLQTALRQTGALLQNGNEISLRFAPDGSIDENNPDYIAIKPKEGEPVYVAPSYNRLNYEINTNQVFRVRR